MAQREIDFQTELVKAAQEEGGFGFKCAHMNLIGISDLSLKIPTFPHFYVECKWIKKPARSTKTSLTEHQFDFIQDYLIAGGRACWIVGYTTKNPLLWGCFVLSPSRKSFIVKPDHFELDESRGHFTRKRGEKWSIEKMLQYAIKAFI